MIEEGNLKPLLDLEEQYDQPLDVPAGEPTLNGTDKEAVIPKRGDAEDLEFPMNTAHQEAYLELPPVLRKTYRAAGEEEREKILEEWRIAHPTGRPLNVEETLALADYITEKKKDA